ncbi:MAG: hypothetical protein KJT03_02640 [Verrucomicrobiae bacterium]|nr:hypothetical protein [Verrucomicrobiae bacterium]
MEQLILADEANIIYAFQWVNLNPAPSLEIKVDPDKPLYDVGDNLEVRFEVKHRGASPATYTFEGDLFSQQPAPEEGETPVVDFAEFETPEPFVLSSKDPERVFKVQATAMKSGVVNLLSSVTVTPDGGESYTLDAEQALAVSPFTTEVTITNKRHQWNKTEEADWGERAKAINTQRRNDGEEPYENLIELEVQVTNNSDSDVENLNIPDARDILSYISSADVSDPSVPLKPIRLYSPDGSEVDLTNPEDLTEVVDVTLPSGETAIFAWVVEAFQIDPEQRDEPYQLEFKPLILGSLDGVNLQIGKTEPFSIRVREPIVVNVTSDDRDADPEDGVIDVDLDTEGEQVSLRAAIEYANEQEGLDRIEFDIPGDGVPEIKVGPPPEGTHVMATGPDGDLFPFPAVESKYFVSSFETISSALKATDPVEIDGTTQHGGWVLITGQEVINLEYSQGVDWEVNAVNGLEVAGGDSLIRGLVINRFPGMGLVLTEKGGNRIVGNILGMDPTGMIAYGNGSVVRINQKVGPQAFDQRIKIDGGSIELHPDWAERGGFDTYAVARLYAGGLLINSPRNQIGGTKVADRNIISGHGRVLNRFHVDLDFEAAYTTPFVSDLVVSGSNARDNQIQGNYIGTNTLGQRSNEGYTARPDIEESVSGILISNGARNNRLSENLTPSIVVEDASETQLIDNVIGLPSEPKGSIDRGGLGLLFATGSVVERNQISGEVGLNESSDTRLIDNSIDGDRALSLYKSNDVVIQGNRIGVDSNNLHLEGEHFWSVSFYDSADIALGGANPGEGNTIAMSGFRALNPPDHKAIQIWSLESEQTEGLRVMHSGNNYVAHPSKGVSKSASIVDLKNDGIDSIDFGDLDGKQNYPRISSVTPEGGNLRFEGNLDSRLGAAGYYIDFYKTPAPFPSGHGGAPINYVGRGTVTTDAGGFGQFNISIPFSDFEESDYFTATAIRADGSGGTSEFSRNRRLNDNILKELNRAAYGDRNGDGTDDVDQDNVSSFSAANGADTTVEVSAVNGQTSENLLPIAQSHFQTLDDSNPTLVNISSETQASMGAPQNYSYSNGILTFEVPDLSAGASVSIRLILSDDASPDTLWVLQADDTWTNALPATINGKQVTLILTDGDTGDRDGEANGRIMAAIGPATALPPIPEMDFTITKESNVHTLSWPLHYVNAQLEFSRDLSPDSWSAMDFLDAEPLEDFWQVTLSNPQTDLFPTLTEDQPDSGFYRLRYQTQSDPAVPYHTWLRNQLENEYGITGGTWITGATEREAMETAYVDPDLTRTDFAADGQPFVWALNLKNSVVPPNNWNDFALFNTQDAIATGDVLLLVVWVRGKDIGEGLPMIRHNFEITETPFTKIYSQQVVTSDEWIQYLIPMEATIDMPDSWYTMHMGFAVQEIEVGGVAVLNYENKYTVDQLPKLNVP